MKKFAIISGILSAGLFVLGCIFSIIGVVTGGPKLIRDYAANGIEYFMEHIDIPLNIDDWNITILQELDGGDFTVSLNEAYPVISTGEYKESQAALGDEVTKVEIYISTGELEIQQSASDDIGISWEGLGRFQYYVEDGTFYVISTEDFGDVTVTLPDKTYEAVKIAASAGEVDADIIKAEETIFYFGACDVSIRQLETDRLFTETGACNLDIESGTVGEWSMLYSASEINYLGNITEKADIKGSAGDVTLMLEKPDSFNYTVNTALGHVVLPGHVLKGNIQNQRLDNGASKEIMIDSMMGNVRIPDSLEINSSL